MDKIKFDDYGISSAKDKVTEAEQKLSEAYDKCVALHNAISSMEAWKGESQKAIIAYLDLVKQYLGDVSGKTGEYVPFNKAEEAYDEELKFSEDFYDRNPDYKRIKDL